MPAPPVALDDIFQVSIVSEYHGETIMLVNNWRVKNLADPGEYLVDCQSIATKFGTVGVGAPLSAYMPLLGTDVNILYSRAQRIYAPRSAYVDQLIGEIGTGGAIANTGNLAGVVARKSDLSGRDQVSVSHLGPIPFDVQEEGELDIAYKLALENWGNVWTQVQTVAGPSGIDLEPVVFHRNTVPPTWNTLRTVLVNPYVRTMRRRTVRVGI